MLVLAGLATTSVAWAGEESKMVPRVSVDSTFRGYGAEVLSDGAWVELGRETTTDHGHADRLGNAGNSWVSADAEVEHWVRLDWEAPARVSQVTIWWTTPDWFPGAFRLEALSDQSWVPVMGPGVWLRATAQKAVCNFDETETTAVRVVQHARGGGARRLMAAQEVTATRRTADEAKIEGAVQLTGEELRDLGPPALMRDLVRLTQELPGSGRTLVWHGDTCSPFTFPHAEDGGGPVALPADTRAVGVEWPIEHVVDGVELRGLPEGEPGGIGVEVRTATGWLPIEAAELPAADGRGRTFSWAPAATDACRVRFARSVRALGGFSVFRHVPADPHTWPVELVEGNRFEKAFLARGREPSFEALATRALTMRPARALIGLEGTREPVGVWWDGTLQARAVTLRFRFGEKSTPLRFVRDTVSRGLVGGWLPAVVVSGQVGVVQVSQIAFVAPLPAGSDTGTLCLRVSLRNLGGEAIAVPVVAEAELVSPFREGCTFRGGKLVSGERILLGSRELSSWDAARRRLTGVVEIAAGAETAIDLRHPLGTLAGDAAAGQVFGAEHDDALAAVRSSWERRLQPLCVRVPEDRVNRMVKSALAQLLICAEGDTLYYGAFPSAYDRRLYGVEEGFAMRALCMLGFESDAKRFMDATYLTNEFLRKVPKYETYAHRHQQYRNGLQPHYAVTLYRLCADEAWVRPHLPLIRGCAEWTIEQRRRTMGEADGERPLHWGLLPKWSYGGDIAGLQCYALYANYACNKGLEDTAWLLEVLGERVEARRYRDEATAFRRLLGSVTDRSVRRDLNPPFLPLRLYADQPVGNDYYQLFAGLVLDLGTFGPNSLRTRVITDYLERTNLAFCGLPRFRRDVGEGGLDGLYGLGHLITKLRQGRVDEFLLGFYAYLAFNMDRDTFTSRETNLLYTSDLHIQTAHRVPDLSDPVPCSGAVPLLLLRHMLVTEAVDDAGHPTGELRLLSGAPRAWFRDGPGIELVDCPTFFGPVSCRVDADTAAGRIEARLVPPNREVARRLAIRIAHPEGKRWESVTVNGTPWTQADPASGWITFAEPGEDLHVVVSY